jgi:hypothetical protein
MRAASQLNARSLDNQPSIMISPDSLRFELLFDAREARHSVLSDTLPWIVASVLGAVFIRWPGLFRGGPRFARIFGIVLAVAGFGVAVSVWSIEEREHARIVGALEHHRYDTVEGVVTDFHPGALDGHLSESFEVGGRQFEYSPYVGLYSYQQIAPDGGQIRGGAYVRIAAIGDQIARLEIRR